MKKKTSNKKTNNRVHQVNTRLTEEEYQKLSAMSEQSGVTNSKIMRNLLDKGRVEVRYDSQSVRKALYEVQENVNKAQHMIMQKIELLEQKQEHLESLKELKTVNPPFRIEVDRVGCEIKETKMNAVERKMNFDKAVTDCVDF